MGQAVSRIRLGPAIASYRILNQDKCQRRPQWHTHSAYSSSPAWTESYRRAWSAIGVTDTSERFGNEPSMNVGGDRSENVPLRRPLSGATRWPKEWPGSEAPSGKNTGRYLHGNLDASPIRIDSEWFRLG
jgi:hypothetical protein